MTERPLMDFDALHAEGTTLGPDGPVLAAAPWQLDEPQPLIVELADQGQFTGPVLDCGCWVGDNALFLASRGLSVTAVDISPSAISSAQAKASARSLPVDFLVSDVTSLDGLTPGFATVLDSALMHCLSDSQRVSYLSAIHRLAAPSARLHVLCFPDFVAGAFPMPGHLDEASLRRDIGQLWDIDQMTVRHYTTNLPPSALQSLVPTASMSLATDDGQGRSLLPIWHIAATRRDT
ncbi:class I SAM-dependent methyltransferase [Kutzneria sp. CA-103260]|uniref:class I SAM-dependent methyltransferase n=1 Tax=Kutzneria sp. CA-103260 TaxID=2802641 RepID=UPI001BA73241|nr:class I SAM-dependent methyltransferase [Kutzneria sp. CA-103260]QUQ64620.1 transferase [Kutzneria sp. CA-103260]